MYFFRSLSKQFMACPLFSLCLIAGTLVGIALRSVEAQQISYETTALSGDSIPGLGPEVSISSFGFSPRLNDFGQATFNAYLSGTNVDGSNDSAIISESGGSLNLIVREGNSAPVSGSTGNFGSVNGWHTNNAGQTLFLSQISGSGDYGIFLESNGTIDLVALKGEIAPGTEQGQTFYHTGGPVRLNEAGQITFRALLRRPGEFNPSVQGLFSHSDGMLRLVAPEGDAVPDLEPGMRYGNISDFRTAESGETVFAAGLTGPGVDNTNDRGIFLEFDGTVQLILRSGDDAPGTALGVQFRYLGLPRFNGTGQIMFFASLTGTGVDRTNDLGIFSDSGGTLSLVVREGDLAPDTKPSVYFERTLAATFNDAGHTTFFAKLTGPDVNNTNDMGIFLKHGGKFELVSRFGNVVPATSAGVNFVRGTFFEPIMNDSGQIAFLDELTGIGVNSTNDRGLFATDSSGKLLLIAREGDLFDVNPDPLATENRTIDVISLEPDAVAGQAVYFGFNNSSQLAFALSFTDGTQGVFVATIGIPEPSALTLLALGGFFYIIASSRGSAQLVTDGRPDLGLDTVFPNLRRANRPM